MRAKRRNIQFELALEPEARGEARSAGDQGTEARTAHAEPERPATGLGPPMEAVVDPGNLRKALARVRRNKGAPGLDGMTVDDLGDHLKNHWPEIRSRLLDGSYTPQPVRRVEIPKASGGVRPLGVPTVLDRFIQQAAMQVLQGDWDPSFSDASYGFRPGRSAHRAVERAQDHIRAGFDIVVDLDLEKFFDRVNHDILMGLVAKRVHRMRQQLVKFRTAQINCLRGLLTEYGEVMPKGRAGMRRGMAEALARVSERLPAMAVEALREQWARVARLDEEIGEIERRLKLWHRENADSRRIAEIPGVGVLSATAAVAAMGDPAAFRSGREFAAWLGLVPRHSGTGGRVRMLGISKRGDTYLRTLLIHGARSVLTTGKSPPEWASCLAERRPANVAAVALAVVSHTI